MHFANTKNSVRLQLMLTALQRGGTYSTADLQSLTRDMAPATTISELRRNGHVIKCCYGWTTAEGRRVYLYQLKEVEKHGLDCDII